MFWRSVIEELDLSFSAPPQFILTEDSSGKYHPNVQWLPGSVMNPAENCLSLNSKRGLDDDVIIWRDEGEENLPLKRMNLKELRHEVWYVKITEH